MPDDWPDNSQRKCDYSLGAGISRRIQGAVTASAAIACSGVCN